MRDRTLAGTADPAVRRGIVPSISRTAAYTNRSLPRSSVVTRTTTVTHRRHHHGLYHPHGRFGFYSSYYGGVGFGVSVGFGSHFYPRYYGHYRPYRYRCWTTPYVSYRWWPRYSRVVWDPWYWDYSHVGYYSGFYLGLGSLTLGSGTGYGLGYSEGYREGLEDGSTEPTVIHNHNYYGDSPAPEAPVEPAPAEPIPEPTPDPESLRGGMGFGDRAARAVATPVSSPVTPADDALEGLSPVRATFALGYLSFQEGDFEQASDLFYNATLAEEADASTHVALSVSLVALGELEYAAGFLRQAHEKDPRIVATPLDLEAFYGEPQAERLEADLARLREHARLHPSDPSVQLVQAYLALNSGEIELAGQAALRVADTAESPSDRQLASDLLEEVENRKQGHVGRIPDEGSSLEFLAEPGLDALPLEDA